MHLLLLIILTCKIIIRIDDKHSYFSTQLYKYTHAQITLSNVYTNVHNNDALYSYCLTRIHYCMYMYDWFYFMYTS